MGSSIAAPVWALTTGGGQLPAPIFSGEALTPERLAECRSILAAFSEAPVATLQVLPPSERTENGPAIRLHTASPLAQQLTNLVSRTDLSSVASRAAESGQAVAKVAETETLYRMVVPAKVAEQFGQGLVTATKSNAVAGGIHGALRSKSGIVAAATFVPVAVTGGEVGAAGAAGAAGTVGVAGAAGAAGLLTVAAPFLFMAVAVGLSAHAEARRQASIQRITDLLEELREEELEDRRSDLEGCLDAVDKATAVLLDEGTIGATLGLDSAVHAISKEMARARRLLLDLERKYDQLPEGAVELRDLLALFPGLDEDSSPLHAKLELMQLALSLKRRIVVLQAVEHAQKDPTKPFETFVQSLTRDQRTTDQIEQRYLALVGKLSSLQLTRSRRLRDAVYRTSEVDRLVGMIYRLRDLQDGLPQAPGGSELVIDMVRSADGSVAVTSAPVG